MLEALKYSTMMGELKSKYGNSRTSIGILFVKPTSQLEKEQIINNLPLFHHRSGTYIDFYLPGYGAYWYDTYPDEKEVCKINGTAWSFSFDMFSKFIDEIESISNWNYECESQLMIVDYNDGKLDFSTTIIIDLEQGVRDKVIDSIPRLFASIFRTAKNNSDTYKISDSLAIKSMSDEIKKNIKSLLPSYLVKIYDMSKPYCTRNIYKNILP